MGEDLRVNKKYFWLAPTAVLLFLYGVGSVGYGVYIPVKMYKEFVDYFPLFLPLLPVIIIETGALLAGGYLLIISAIIFFNKTNTRQAINKGLIGSLLVLYFWGKLAFFLGNFTAINKSENIWPLMLFIILNLFLFWQLYRISKKKF